MYRFILPVLAGFIFFTAQSQTFTELTDTKPRDSEAAWRRLKNNYNFSWGNTDTRYPKYIIPVKQGMENPDGGGTAIRLTAWRGERVNAQAVLYVKDAWKDVSVKVSDLRSGSHIIPSAQIKISPVAYVMTDELNKDGKGACGHRPDPTKFDSSIVADILDHHLPGFTVEANSTRPVWVSVDVPANVQPGNYKGTLTATGAGAKALSLSISIQVLNRTLPDPSKWSFHLDLWQNPYAVARFHNVPLWSREHFDHMRPLMKMLAGAGQKIITATIMQLPWAGQTYDPFSSMVQKIKNIDGSWQYDYEVFDKWATYMMQEIGIDAQINCYTMIPWAMNFDYYDKGSNSVKFIHAKTGSPEFAGYWMPFLKDFARHLKSKGWFEKTTIAMDERSLADMQSTIKLIKNADAGFKVSLAGNYHKEIEADIYDYCIAFGQHFPTEIKAERDRQGKRSTVYTCCTEPFPNTFTFSAPAEARWLGWHTAAGNYDGYLRWAYNSWTRSPLQDSRFKTWAAGDCYLVYPGGRSSIRFERLREGIQDFEKISVLRRELASDPQKLKKLNGIISNFTMEGKAAQTTEQMIRNAQQLLNSL